ncbi:hypothetical protein K502DRAFT_350127, partial [Neoconidiobolus thromboides FSU 785]
MKANTNPIVAVLVTLLQLNASFSLPLDGTATTDTKPAAQGAGILAKVEGLVPNPLALPVKAAMPEKKPTVEVTEIKKGDKGTAMIPNDSTDAGNPKGLPNSSYSTSDAVPEKKEGESTDELAELSAELIKHEVEIKAHEDEIKELE